MRFWDAKASITEVFPNLWQGATPQPGADFSIFGSDVRVYVFFPCEHGITRADVIYKPFQDNPADPVENPPKIIGISVDELNSIADAAADRVNIGRTTIFLCQWGYNRSGLGVGLTAARLGYKGAHIVDRMRGSRGPHPMGFGDALNNGNFRSLVLQQAAARNGT